MTKKTAMIIVILVEVAVYLFLLVGLPAMVKALVCPTCNFREIFPTPLILYLLPGIIGLFMGVIIWKKKEVKK